MEVMKVNGFKLLVCALLVGILIFALYYFARTKELFGLRRYSKINFSYCVEPLLFNQKENFKASPEEYENWQSYRNEELGFGIKIPPDWLTRESTIETAGMVGCGSIDSCFFSTEYEAGFADDTETKLVGGRLDIEKVGMSSNLEEFIWNKPSNWKEFLTGLYDCEYLLIGGKRAIGKSLPRQVYFVDRDDSVFVIMPSAYNSKAEMQIEKMMASIKWFEPNSIEENPLAVYSGTPSPQVPYDGLKFQDISVNETKYRAEEFAVNDFMIEGLPMDGFTFAANEGTDMAIRVENDRTNPKDKYIDFTLELYGYGPSVIKAESNLEWGVPVTGRYFLVVKAKPNRSRLGKYRLTITTED